jgi:putative ABC transport system substrate-binding protein
MRATRGHAGAPPVTGGTIDTLGTVTAGAGRSSAGTSEYRGHRVTHKQSMGGKSSLRRRRLLAAAAAPSLVPVLAPLLARPARAQEEKIRIGYLGGRSAAADAHLVAAVKLGLQDGGYDPERQVTIEYRWAEGDYGQLPRLVAELVATRPRVLVATGGSATSLAAKAASSSVPVLFSAGGDPVALGLVDNLARPRGNVTGLTMFSSDLDAKRLALLRELRPADRRAGLLLNPDNPSTPAQEAASQRVAGELGLTLDVVRARNAAEIDAGLGALSAECLAVASDAFLIGQRGQILEWVSRRRWPAVYAVREFAEEGGLMSYGTRFADMYRLLGQYCARLLGGASPADLPVQQPSRYELIVNAGAARRSNITLPAQLLFRADEVIE